MAQCSLRPIIGQVHKNTCLYSVKREIRACKCRIENFTQRVSKPHFVPNCLEISRGRLQLQNLS